MPEDLKVKLQNLAQEIRQAALEDIDNTINNIIAIQAKIVETVHSWRPGPRNTDQINFEVETGHSWRAEPDELDLTNSDGFEDGTSWF